MGGGGGVEGEGAAVGASTSSSSAVELKDKEDDARDGDDVGAMGIVITVVPIVGAATATAALLLFPTGVATGELLCKETVVLLERTVAGLFNALVDGDGTAPTGELCRSLVSSRDGP